MGLDFERITGTIKDALANPELDKVKAEVKQSLEQMKNSPENTNITAVLLESGLRGLRTDLEQLKIEAANWPAFEKIYRQRFELVTKGLERQAIFESMEAKKLDAFVDDFAQYAKLDAVIAECKQKESKKPLIQLIRFMQSNSSMFKGMGGGILSWLGIDKAEDKKDKTTPAPTTQTPPASNLDQKAAEADKILNEDKGKTTEEEKKQPKKPKKKTKVESATASKYEPIPRLSEKTLTGTEFMNEYEKLKSPKQRHMLVLQQLALGNVPEHFKTFETLKLTGEKGTVVEIEVARHGLRIGSDADYVELPLDGPTAMAAAEIYGCTLSTPWISDMIHQRAVSTKGRVKFITAPQIAKELGITNWDPDHPDGAKMMSPEFVRKRNELLKKWREEHNIRDDQLTSGYFKDIVHPIPGRTKSGQLEIYGGYYSDSERIQPVSGGFHERAYFDYSHLARFVRGTVKVNGQAMTLSDFTNNQNYADEFGFDQMPLGQAYPYPPELQTFVDEHKPKPANA